MNYAQNWYYSINSQQHGPVTRAQLDQFLASGAQEGVLVWSQGMDDWIPAAELGQPAPQAPVMPYASPHSPAYTSPHLSTRRTSGLAIASMVLGIFAILTSGFLVIPQMLAVVFGHIALGQCSRDPNVDGRGMAIAGLIMGYLFVALMLGFLLLIFVGIMSA